MERVYHKEEGFKQGPGYFTIPGQEPEFVNATSGREDSAGIL